MQRLLKELKIDLLYNPTISCLSIHPKEFITRYHRDTNIPILIAIVSIIPKMWKQTKCPLIDKQINKNVLCAYTDTLFSLKEEGSSAMRNSVDTP